MPLTIQLTGNYGSGKSHAIRKFMAGKRVEHLERQKVFYRGHLVDGSTFVLGDYVTNDIWQGPDTLGYEYANELITENHRKGHHVIFETLMDDVSPHVDQVICLVSPLSVCIAGMRARGLDHYVAKITAHHKKYPGFRAKVQRLGVPLHVVDRASISPVLDALILSQ